MRIRIAPLWALAASALVAESGAFACNPLDANCNPPPPDPCSGYSGNPSDYNYCRLSIPGCTGLSGPPLNSCLYAGLVRRRDTTNTSTSTSTGSSTSTSTNRAIAYTATLINNGLYNNEVQNNALSVNITRDPTTGSVITTSRGTYTVPVVSRDPATGLVTTAYVVENQILSQKDAFDAQSQLLMACTVTNLTGRNDGLCAANPNLPECTGLTASLLDATTCRTPGPPNPTTGQPTCLAYGAYGYNIDEWLVFGQQYYNGMTGCFAVGDATDTTGAAANPDMVLGRGFRLDSTSDYANLPPVEARPAVQNTSASTITGKLRKGSLTEAQTIRWKAVADKVDDGAAYLGLERGDLIKAAASGQTFLSAFTASPFAEALVKDTRELVETALNDPKETIDKVKEKTAMVAEAAGESSGAGSNVSTGKVSAGGLNARAPAAVGTAGSNGGAQASAVTSPNAAGEAASYKDGAGAANDAKVAGGGGAGFGGAGAGSGGAKGASAGASGGAGVVKDRARELAEARALLGAPNRAKSAAMAGLPSSQGSPELGSVDASLFERVKASYRRHTPAMGAYYDESKTARDVRLTEKPAFFKDL